jgi:hypothetical protein
MTRVAQVPLERENFLVHARSKKETLSAADENRIIELVIEIINKFLENWDEYYSNESRRLLKIEEHILRALAGLIVDRYQWEGDAEEYIPFEDEEGAYRWLSGNGDNPNNDDPHSYLDDESDWEIRSLWDVAKSIDREWSGLEGWAEARTDEEYHQWGIPETPSRLPYFKMELISHFCRIWHDQVDAQLGLPRKDPNPDNPLLRFIDAGMAVCLGDKRPHKKTVLQMIAKYIKPAIQQEDKEEVLRQKEEDERREQWAADGVDFDPMFEDEKSPR